MQVRGFCWRPSSYHFFVFVSDPSLPASSDPRTLPEETQRPSPAGDAQLLLVCSCKTPETRTPQTGTKTFPTRTKTFQTQIRTFQTQIRTRTSQTRTGTSQTKTGTFQTRTSQSQSLMSTCDRCNLFSDVVVLGLFNSI